MAAAEKQTNCDVTIHTDFGMVWELLHVGTWWVILRCSMLCMMGRGVGVCFV
jgi:hypothetical protein